MDIDEPECINNPSTLEILTSVVPRKRKFCEPAKELPGDDDDVPYFGLPFEFGAPKPKEDAFEITIDNSQLLVPSGLDFAIDRSNFKSKSSPHAAVAHSIISPNKVSVSIQTFNTVRVNPNHKEKPPAKPVPPKNDIKIHPTNQSPEFMAKINFNLNTIAVERTINYKVMMACSTRYRQVIQSYLLKEMEPPSMIPKIVCVFPPNVNGPALEKCLDFIHCRIPRDLNTLLKNPEKEASALENYNLVLVMNYLGVEDFFKLVKAKINELKQRSEIQAIRQCSYLECFCMGESIKSISKELGDIIAGKTGIVDSKMRTQNFSLTEPPKIENDRLAHNSSPLTVKLVTSMKNLLMFLNFFWRF